MLIANVLRKLIRESSLLAPDLESFKRQESIFIVLNLLVLATLLLVQTLFSAYFGPPPRLSVIVLAAGFLANVIELVWLQSEQSLGPVGIVVLTWAAIGLNMLLAFVLASVSYRQDIQYFALLVGPILQAAFRFSLIPALTVVSGSIVLTFFWVWNYFRLHPPVDANEYVEAGTISIIYAIVGILVWTLVKYLRSKESDLERAKQRLLTEEKLAAVGRFSSAIAHEIRNPVAMISSALSTAFHGNLQTSERQEMFEIAAKEASRLEKLTTDFLAYARPRTPDLRHGDIAESVAYVADICRPRAAEKSVTIQADTRSELRADIDGGQVQQALLNLVMNAVDASPAGAVVALYGTRKDGVVAIEIENANGPIHPDAVKRIFEPFFTTKPSGTGLGLAIARNIARSHGGDVTLSHNDRTVRFSLTFPACDQTSEHA
jgi:signal transduction histidine kinase